MSEQGSEELPLEHKTQMPRTELSGEVVSSLFGSSCFFRRKSRKTWSLNFAHRPFF